MSDHEKLSRAFGFAAKMFGHKDLNDYWEKVDSGRAKFHHALELEKIRSRLSTDKLLQEHNFRHREKETDRELQERHHQDKMNLQERALLAKMAGHGSSRHGHSGSGGAGGRKLTAAEINKYNTVTKQARELSDLSGTVSKIEDISQRVDSGGFGGGIHEKSIQIPFTSTKINLPRAWTTGLYGDGIDEADLASFEKHSQDLVMQQAKGFGNRAGVRIAEMIAKAKPNLSNPRETNLGIVHKYQDEMKSAADLLLIDAASGLEKGILSQEEFDFVAQKVKELKGNEGQSQEETSTPQDDQDEDVISQIAQ